MKKVFLKLAFVLLVCALTISIVGCTLLIKPDEEIPHTHEYTEEITKASTCTEAGEKTFTCSCGDSYTEAIEILSHTEKTIPAVAPTCTAAGLTEGKVCKDCDKVLVKQESVDALGHNYTSVVTAPTCTEAGYTTHTCSGCNDSFVDSAVDALGHGYLSIVTAPTCTEGGYTTHTCARCGDSYVDNQVDALGHDYVSVVTDPTCIEGGYTTYTCSVCGDSYVDDTVDALGHTEKILPAVDATCTSTGLTEGKECTECGEILLEQEITSVLEHSYSDGWSSDETNHWHECTACGDKADVSEHSYNNACDADCNECGEIRVTEGHVYDNNCDSDCNECGETRLPEDHVYDNNCDADCNECGEERIPQDHVYDNNCDADCDECGEIRVTAGHVYDNNCDSDCNECGEIRVTEGHVYYNNCDSDCNECGETRTPQDHVYDNNCDINCNECGNARVPQDHVYDNNCDADCNECGETRITQDHVYDSDSDADCNECGAVRTLAPTVIGNEVVKSYDVYDLENKANITLDLSENVDNAGNLELSYVVAYGADEVRLDGSLYTFNFGNYTDAVTNEILTVTVYYVANGEEQSIQYTYKLAMKDTGAYRLVNGGFENGMDGWTQVGTIGNADSSTHYWVGDPERAEGFAFGMDGEKMFSAYAPGAFESSVGTLTSSSFKIGGSGFVTFKVGAMRDGNYVYVDVVDAETKEILARFYNGLWADRTDDVKSGCTLIAYKADLSRFAGKEVFFRISDNADSGYGLFFADSFITYYENEPEGFNEATPVNYEISGTIYDVFNGGFEMGDVQGWWNIGEPGHVTGAEAFFSGVAYGKNGNFLYSGVEDHLAGNGKEGNRGSLTSSVFELGGTGYISFMLGGGGNALCYVQVIDATTNEVLARYHQQAMEDAVLKQYIADLSAYIGRTVRIQVVDMAERDWGCVSFDNVVTYYASLDSLPEGIVANDIKGELKYTVDNGSFESGNLDGWHMNITEAGAHNTLGWVESSEHDAGWYTKNDDNKDGNFLFTFTKPDGTNCENTKGTLESSTFSLKQGSFVSFRFGGAGGGSNHDVYIELCRADGSVIARFYNDAPGKVNTRMNAYYYQYQGAEVNCFFRIVDNSTGDYGCFVVDDFRVNLESAPEGFIGAIQ